ncbi:UNVERIFIED_CONTAM: Transposon Tf2-11 polyprotein [Sesamum latifolium]|uniref:Transposon Tf2-11 polyprotein n=1 Tax=Sesamum latifolium TaxID=2727402 RepID=A0AAW2WS19_9LAMI
MTRSKLTNRQAHWEELLSEFHFVLEYRVNSSNHIADTLSRRADLTSLVSIAALTSSTIATSIRDQAHELLPKDPATQGLVHLIEQGKAWQVWLEDGLLMNMENHLYVRKGGDLRKSLISKCHDTLWDKADYQKKAGLLQPLPILKRPWESVSIDYLSGLSKVGDVGSIIILVYRLSKYTTFIAAPKYITTEGTIYLFCKHIVKYWSLPKDIVSDGESRFTGIF